MKTGCRIFICVLLLFFTSVYGFAQSPFNTVRSRISKEFTASGNNKKLAAQATALLHSQQSNGSWPDIDYTDSSATKWAPAEHLDRAKNLAVVYTKTGNDFLNQPSVYNAILAALRFWYTADPKSGNWWHNEIATPKDVGEIVILLQDSPNPLPASLTDSLVARMKRGNPYQKTGANKLDIAIHYLYRACITENGSLMDSAVEQAFQPIAFTTEEGLQHDYSYQQHGAQLQISSYGLVFLSGEYKIASLVRGTPYALSGQKLELLGHYLVNTFLPAIRGHYIDFNTEGRGVARMDILDKLSLAEKAGLLHKAVALHPQYRSQIEAAIKRIGQEAAPGYEIQPAHTHFWKGDYTQHIRPGYNFNVRTVSVRTKRTESGNRENLLGKFLPDGSTNIQRRGDEYFNIMPIWEWDKIPGITARNYAQDQAITVQWGEAGSTRFVGGVSDSLYGATAYDMDYNGVRAKKAWFFFDKEVVCLGAGITASAAEEVVTTLNQCWLNGPVSILTNGRTQPLGGDAFSGLTDAVWHDSVGYFFPTPQPITVSGQVQKGSWSQIDAKTSDKELAGKVFKLWVNHGATPQAASYAYIVMPGIGAAELKKEAVQDVTILQNTSEVQAVHHKGLTMLQAIFYKPGKLSFGAYTIAVDKPCALLIKEAGKSLEVNLSDPTQTEKNVVVTIKNASGLVKEFNCSLPKGIRAGETVSTKIALP